MESFMSEALIEAKKSLYEFKEVPVGCVLVYKNQIVARGHNLVTQTANPTRHAEFVCIDQVLDFSKTNSLDFNDVFQEIIVVVTVEPCIMCMTALFNLKVKEIIYGCKNDRFGGATVVNVANLLNNNSTKIISGVREEEAMRLLKEFYQGENPSAPISAKVKKTKNKNNDVQI
jgi:tRNA-specific adenosine deaminase 2